MSHAPFLVAVQVGCGSGFNASSACARLSKLLLPDPYRLLPRSRDAGTLCCKLNGHLHHPSYLVASSRTVSSRTVTSRVLSSRTPKWSLVVQFPVG